jgi:lipopolysaccharide/colanic/teichoic acid biosynthesis glycosyltransferase
MRFRIFDCLGAITLIILTLPLWPIIYVAVKLTSEGPFIFTQTRIGKNKKPFIIYKIRTMVKGAEDLKKRYVKHNEADGPVFKIQYDPRFTPVGKFLTKYALDELPQLLNVLKGEMAIVGPRPLPIDEAKKIPKKYKIRFSVLPGMTSLWVISGAHRLSFKQWMDLDAEYVKYRKLKSDIFILIRTINILVRIK